MTIAEKKQHCSGCYCDVYNYGLGGAKECWWLAEMKLVEKIKIHKDARPPHAKLVVKIPACYHVQDGCFVNSDQINARGFLT